MINKEEVSIIIADDHPILLKGLYDELISNGYNVIGSAIDGKSALQLVIAYEPTLMLLDIDMPSLTGFEVIKAAKEKGSKTKFIVLSFHKEMEFLTEAKTLQIQGYLLKEDSFSEIEKCMEAVLNNEQYFSSSFETRALKNASDGIKRLKLLTPSEITILKLAAQQFTTNNIADTLGVSIRTVEKHRSNIIIKLHIEKTNNSLVSWILLYKSIILEL